VRSPASLADDAPAQKAGLEPGDIVVRVAGRSVGGMTPDQVQQLVRGPAGTKVTLALRSPQAAGIRHFKLTRQEIGKSSVTWQVLPGTRIAQVQISAFNTGTSAKLAETLASIQRAGATGLILDLRDNPGGYLSEAVGVASQFLEGGNVVLEKDAKGRVTPQRVEPAGPKCKLPMVVLVNYESASASEIVSGALQDAKRAILVGEKTLGTGTVLTEFQLSDGSALLLAIEEWLTPSGKSIWHQGITPDVAVALPPDANMVSPEASGEISLQQLQASGDQQLLQALELLQGASGDAAYHHPEGGIQQPRNLS
jgi:carboxyl-terminal processing protease